MADVRDGLESGSDAHGDVNTDSGFLAALGRQAGNEVAVEELDRVQGSDRDVMSAIEYEGTESARREQPRDDSGRFASRQPESEEVPAEGAAPEATEQQESDPWDGVPEEVRQQFEAKVKEAEEAQKLIGRHSGEVGELREKLARLEGRIDERQSASQQATPVTPEAIEHVENLVAERGGQVAMQWAIQNAPHLIDSTLEAWGVDDPVAAARFAVRYERALLDQGGNRETNQQVQEDPAVAWAREQATTQERNRSYSEAMQKVKITHEALDQLEPHVGKVLRENPLVKNAVVSDDHETRVTAFATLVQLARAEAGQAVAAEASNERQQQAAAQKRAAQVASGSARPVERRQPASGDALTPEERAEAVTAFHKRLLATETTSVRDGLTGV